MEPITYSLLDESKDSEHYYSLIKEVTDAVLLKANEILNETLSDFKSYLKTYGLERIREKEEYILELLSFGVLWRVYSVRALSVRTAPFITMSKMGEWRKKHQNIKPAIDWIRGILLTLFMFPKIHKSIEAKIPTLNQVDYVCKWFEATGEFREQALRFVRWRAFWSTKSSDELYKIFSLIHNFTDWFESFTVITLGKYTTNVESFLESSAKTYRWREDRISCTRSRLEYHLNMVGAELMNRAFREEFERTQTRVVLVPGCMRGRPSERCESVKVKEGLRCMECFPGCRVNQMVKLGKKYSDEKSFEVYIIPHASDLSLWSPRNGKPLRGVVASACITTLVEGGWELKRYNVPAQCVLLDCSGCKKHWHPDGFPTSLNIKELKRRIYN
jgi:uncharacterized protein